MATRKKSRKPQPSPWQTFADALMRPGLIGALLVLVAVFTLLSLVAGSRGSVTGAWVQMLRSFVGAGAWLVPLVAGFIGLALVIAAIEQVPAPAWRRPLGVVLLFVAFITITSLLVEPALRSQVAARGEAGGWLGGQIATLLQTSVSSLGAWAFVGLLIVAGVIFLTDRLLLDGAMGFGLTLQERRARRHEPIVRHGQVRPPVPLPQGELPFWKRWRERFAPKGDFMVGDYPSAGAGDRPVRSQPAAVDPRATASAATSAPAGATDQAQPRTPAPNLPPTQGEVLHPRIIGGTQEWQLPRLADMLSESERRNYSDDEIRDNGHKIVETLAFFGVPAHFEEVNAGPSVTQYLIKPGYVERNIKGEQQKIKVKVAKIQSLSNDLALALAASSVRIEAPVPGTNYVGIEVPNHESNVVGLKELMESETFTGMKARLKIALGEDVKGQAVVADLARMPHLLIAGATGSGKSVCINSIITCLLLTHTPDSLRLLMVDPKMVELSVYNGAPHLLSPVVTEVDKAAGVLFWAVKEMERRYSLFNKAGARDLGRYNEYLAKRGEKALPTIVVIVDEMADLMMAAPEEVEKHICRLAQMARATGIHLIIATQRPSVDVITGLIKANFPARIAFAVTSQVDSRVILDVPGAERLLGRGDMLFMAPDASKLERLQGAYLSDDEINKVVRYWRGVRVTEPAPAAAPWQQNPLPLDGVATTPTAGEAAVAQPAIKPAAGAGQGQPPAFATPAQPRTVQNAPDPETPLFAQIEAMKAVDGRDDLYDDAVRAVQEAGRGSVSLLQRKLRIGYGRAARLIDQLEEAGVLGPDPGGTAGRPLTGATAPASPPTQAARPRIIGDDEDESAAPKPSVWM